MGHNIYNIECKKENKLLVLSIEVSIDKCKVIKHQVMKMYGFIILDHGITWR
jgi:hypothetical protein